MVGALIAVLIAESHGGDRRRWGGPTGAEAPPSQPGPAGREAGRHGSRRCSVGSRQPPSDKFGALRVPVHDNGGIRPTSRGCDDREGLGRRRPEATRAETDPASVLRRVPALGGHRPRDRPQPGLLHPPGPLRGDGVPQDANPRPAGPRGGLRLGLIAWVGFAIAYLWLGVRAFRAADHAELVRRILGSPLPRPAWKRWLLAGGGSIVWPVSISIWAFLTIVTAVINRNGPPGARPHHGRAHRAQLHRDHHVQLRAVLRPQGRRGGRAGVHRPRRSRCSPTTSISPPDAR